MRRRLIPPPRRQRGIAAITAILVVTIATMLAVDLVWELNLDVRQTQNLLVRDRATQFALGAERWLEQYFKQDRDENDYDYFGDIWAQEVPPIPFDGGTVTGNVEDMSGRFNLNNLVDGRGQQVPIQVEIFQGLLEALELSPDIAEAVADWLDANQLPEGVGGAEDDIYTLRDPPYRTANYFFQSASELLAVDGVDGDVYKILAPHVVALPNPTDQSRINVNTATPQLLLALHPAVTQSEVEQWVTDRLASPAQQLDDFWDVFTDATMRKDLNNLLGIDTNWFRLKVIASLGTTQLSMYSLLERDALGSIRSRRRTYDAY